MALIPEVWQFWNLRWMSNGVIKFSPFWLAWSSSDSHKSDLSDYVLALQWLFAGRPAHSRPKPGPSEKLHMDFWSPCFLCISGLKIPVVSAAPNIHPCSLAQWDHCALLGCYLPVPWSGKCPEEWGQGQFGLCLMCFPAVKNLSAALPVVNAWTWLTCFV